MCERVDLAMVIAKRKLGCPVPSFPKKVGQKHALPLDCQFTAWILGLLATRFWMCERVDLAMVIAKRKLGCPVPSFPKKVGQKHALPLDCQFTAWILGLLATRFWMCERVDLAMVIAKRKLGCPVPSFPKKSRTKTRSSTGLSVYCLNPWVACYFCYY